MNLSSLELLEAGYLSPARQPTVAWRICWIIAPLVGKAVKLATGHAFIVGAASIACPV